MQAANIGELGAKTGERSAITFTATSNTLILPEAIPGVGSIRTPKKMVRETKAFQSFYDKDHSNSDEEESDAASPKVLLVKGTHGSTPVHRGLVGTMLLAYNHHHHLQLRADDIWITILAQFCAYVNGRAEALRSKFVKHQGQKELEVVGLGTIHSADFGWFTRAMLDEIEKELVDATVAEWFLPGFSTTTPNDEVCAAATAMCSLQHFFQFKFALRCGIPKVTLLGSVDDWKRLRSKIEQLSSYDEDGAEKVLADQWVPLLRRVCDNFVESAQNGSANNLEFWDTIVCDYGGGSGPEYISGWASVFSFFDTEGKVIGKTVEEAHVYFRPGDEPKHGWPLVDSEDVNANVVSCPVTIDDNGVIYESRLFVGQMSMDVQQDKTDEDAPDATPRGPPPASDAGGPAHQPDGRRSPNMLGKLFSRNPKRQRLLPRNDWALVIHRPQQQQ